MKHLILFAALLTPLAAHADDFDWAVFAGTVKTMRADAAMTHETNFGSLQPVQNCAELPVIQQDFPRNILNKVTTAGTLRLNGGGQVVIGAPLITQCTGKVVWQAEGGGLYVDTQFIARAIAYHLNGDTVVWYDGAGEHVFITTN